MYINPGAFALQQVVAADHPALGADRALGPETGFHEGMGGFFVVEVRGGEDGHVWLPEVKPFSPL